MRSFLLIALALAVPLTPAAAQGPLRDPVDEAVDRGLAYLKSAQNADGSWPAEAINRFRGPGPNGDLAVTALAVMAFLSAGHVPGEGPYRETVEKGVRYVTSHQARNGLFAAQTGGQTEMYYHGICTLMLAEVAGMTDARTADDLRDKLKAAVAVVLEAQRKTGPHAGGWRYTVSAYPANDADLSVTGWQLMALRAAKNVGCDVPADRIQAAVEYVKKCHDARTGGYMYTVTFGNVTVPCTGTGILAMELCGKEYHGTAEAVRAASYLLKTPLAASQQHFFYGAYYTAQGMFQLGTSLGTNYWRAYRDELHRALLRTNPPQATGAWTGRGVDDGRLGPAYCTSMAILALTVEYRLLPIYQRFEEPKERDGVER